MKLKITHYYSGLSRGETLVENGHEIRRIEISSGYEMSESEIYNLDGTIKKPSFLKDDGHRYYKLRDKNKNPIDIVFSRLWWIVNNPGMELRKGDQIEHVKEDATNNSIDNLRIATAKENCGRPKHRKKISESYKNPSEARIEGYEKIGEANKGNTYGKANKGKSNPGASEKLKGNTHNKDKGITKYWRLARELEVYTGNAQDFRKSYRATPNMWNQILNILSIEN